MKGIMLKSTKDGTTVWFRLSTDPTYKIVWPLELYLKMIEESRSDAEVRANWFSAGKISKMTTEEMGQVGVLPPAPWIRSNSYIAKMNNAARMKKKGPD